MLFFIKYISDGQTVIVELENCSGRGEAVKRLNIYKEKADDNNVSLTSDPERVAQWQKLVRLESEITPQNGPER